MQKEIITIDGYDMVFNNVLSIYNEMAIDFSKPLSIQERLLYEDLVQIKFNNGMLLDIGWYPEYEISGQFTIVLLKNETQWDLPIMKEYATDKESLILKLKKIRNFLG